MSLDAHNLTELMSTYVIEPDDEDGLSAYLVGVAVPKVSVKVGAAAPTAAPEVDGRGEIDAFVARILALDPLAVVLWKHSPSTATVCSKDSARSQTEVRLWDARLSDAQVKHCRDALEAHGVAVQVMYVAT